MRDRYYRSLNGTGSLAGDGSFFTAMSSDITAVTSVHQGKIVFTTSLTQPWLVPAFLAESQTNSEGVTLTPVMEVLCVNLRYPATSMAASESLPISIRLNSAPAFLSTPFGSFSGVQPNPDVGTVGFEFITESPHPYYIGRWGVRMHDYSFDIPAGTYIDLQIPDSHAYEFKQEIGAAQQYAPPEARHPPTQCTVNGILATEVLLPTYTPYADPMAAMTAYKLALKGPSTRLL
jgi:hypothetical protein